MAAKQHRTARLVALTRPRAFLVLSFFLAGIHHGFAQNTVFTNQSALMTQTNMLESLPPLQTNEVAPNLYQAATFGAVTNVAVLPGPTTGTGLLPSPIFGRSALAGLPPVGAITGGQPIYQAGPVDLHAHLSYSVTYGSGIEGSPGQTSSTVINTVSPGVTFLLGSHWTLDYTPSLMFYSSPAFQDTTQQTVVLQGATTFEDWSFSLRQDYANSTEPLVETGTQTAQEDYDTSVTASVQLGSQWSSQSSLSQTFRFAPGFNDLEEWMAAEWLNYEVAQGLSLGLGIDGGYDLVSMGSDMPFEDFQGRLTFSPGRKLNITLSGGVQERQFVDPSAQSLISPIFSASIGYQLFRTTGLSVSAQRSVSPSFYGNQVITLTSVAASVQQQLSRRWSFGVSGGYSDEPFTSIAPAPLPLFFLGPQPIVALQQVRDDTSTYATASLSVAVDARINGAVFYTVMENSSGQSNFRSTSHQVGLSLNWQY